MTLKEHYIVFWLAFWPSLALFGVAYGIVNHRWLPALAGGLWLLATGYEVFKARKKQ